jgi:single-strand DNA-binding protein
MQSVSKTILVGRLGKDPEVKTIGSGNTVANFSVATSESYKDKTTQEKKDITEWHNIVLWGKSAEFAGKYAKKGDQVAIVGKNKTRSWEKDGVTRYTTEVICDEFTLLTSKSDRSSSSNDTGASGDSNAFEPAPANTDDLPF